MTVAVEDFEDLRASVRSFFNKRAPESFVRSLAATPDCHDPDLWRQMSTQLGLQSMSIPEQFGGDGYGTAEQSLVLEEMGRALAPSPFFASVVLAARALLVSGDVEACEEYLPGIADGTVVATLAVAEREGEWDPALVKTRAIADKSGSWTLNGLKSWVPSAHSASLILVVGRTTAGPSLFAVDSTAEGVSIEPMAVLDSTRPLAKISLENVTGRLVGRDGGAGRTMSRVLDFACVALAAEQVGIGRRCLEMSVAYAKDRRQFGRPIGSFQAVKHLCAEMLASVELAAASCAHAARLADDGSEDASIAAAAAHITCSTAAMFVTKETIQVHGGIGFTWEHPAHLYFRRAKASQMLLGGPAVYHERLLDRMGI